MMATDNLFVGVDSTVGMVVDTAVEG
jgi:hypothetical protein